MNRVLTTEEVESIIDANILESTDVNTANKDLTTPTEFQFQDQFDICDFKCKWVESLAMHMSKNIAKLKA